MIVGFTGTRRNLTAAQFNALCNLIQRTKVDLGHHGDCINGDEIFHAAVRVVWPEATIVVHPPKNPKYRAYCTGDVILPEFPYLMRNHNIVDQIKDYGADAMLIACPKESKEKLRGGTWATMRYARDKVLIVTIFPNGSIGYGVHNG